MQDTFLTISTPVESLYTEKGSKFFGYAFPIKTEDEVKVHLNELKKNHHKARHFCYGFILGKQGERHRNSDAGEPSGTAGPPIEGQIRSKELTNTLVVSVRYFGGTKLGVSGLIHAYKTNAKETLDEAKIIEKLITNDFQIHFRYPLMSAVMRMLKADGISIENQQFEMDCKIDFSVRLNLEESLIQQLKQLNIINLKKVE